MPAYAMRPNRVLSEFLRRASAFRASRDPGRTQPRAEGRPPCSAHSRMPRHEVVSEMDEQQRVEIVKAVEESMRAFEAAEHALDAERVIAHFAGGADHYIYNDGQRLTHEALAVSVRVAFLTLQSMEGGFADVDVMVLAPDAALVAATFEETVTTRAGGRMEQRGVASWLWRHVGGDWRIVYGQVDHYPDASTR